jgi:hypothetical protein
LALNNHTLVWWSAPGFVHKLLPPETCAATGNTHDPLLAKKRVALCAAGSKIGSSGCEFM